MQEIWKDIKGYEGLYQVSNLGRVKSLERLAKSNNNNYRIVKEKFLKKYEDKDGYIRVSLNKNSKSLSYPIHRLIAEAFIPNFNNLPQINHKDENKKNNCINNLEWCTTKYNCNYGTRTQRCKQKEQIPIEQYDLNGNLIKKWDSAKQVYNKLGYDFSLIRKCCNNKIDKAYNYIWKNCIGYKKGE